MMMLTKNMMATSKEIDAMVMMIIKKICFCAWLWLWQMFVSNLSIWFNVHTKYLTYMYVRYIYLYIPILIDCFNERFNEDVE